MRLAIIIVLGLGVLTGCSGLKDLPIWAVDAFERGKNSGGGSGAD